MSGLSPFFSPSSVAVVGASGDRTKVASIIYFKLVAASAEGQLKAKVFPVNPRHSRIGRTRCYPDLTSLPIRPDLVILAVPVDSTLRLVEEAARRGAKALIIVAGGFAEAGRLEVEKRIATVARKAGMRVLGPNTIGLLDTSSGMDTLFLPGTKRLPDGREVVSLLTPIRGGVVIVTQSGHLGEVVAEELRSSGVGVRALVGVGNQLDVSIEDVLEHFSDDTKTKVIAVYIEGVKDGRRFLSKASRASKKKPIVVFKLGKTEAGAKAAITHTASLVGDYRVYEAVFRQAGLVEARSIEELVDDCVAFSMLPEARGNRIAILTNAGGSGAIAADESGRVGLDVRPPSPRLTSSFNVEFSRASFSGMVKMGNPLDLTATARTEELVHAFDLLARSKEYDMVLAFPTHQPPTVDFSVVEQISSIARRARKPVVVGSMGSSELAELFHKGFLERGIPSYPTPERCVGVLRALAQRNHLRSISQSNRRTGRNGIPQLGRSDGWLSAELNQRLLDEYGIKSAKAIAVRTKEGVHGAADALRFPVAVKLISKSLIHKSEAGGVALGVMDLQSLSSTFDSMRARADELELPFEGVLVQEMVNGGIELILGATRDAVFGPTVIFGMGGTEVEILKDFSVAVGAIDRSQALVLMHQIKMWPILDGYRGGVRVDKQKVAEAISSFSRILDENPSISQMEINPLIATRNEVIAADVRTMVAPPNEMKGRELLI